VLVRPWRRTAWQLERSRNKVAVGEPAAGLTPFSLV
jgi:hypothetical protein